MNLGGTANHGFGPRVEISSNGRLSCLLCDILVVPNTFDSIRCGFHTLSKDQSFLSNCSSVERLGTLTTREGGCRSGGASGGASGFSVDSPQHASCLWPQRQNTTFCVASRQIGTGTCTPSSSRKENQGSPPDTYCTPLQTISIPSSL
jgi:hypothetical protein